MIRQSHLCSPPTPLTLPAIPFPLDAWCFFFLEGGKKKKKKGRETFSFTQALRITVHELFSKLTGMNLPSTA